MKQKVFNILLGICRCHCFLISAATTPFFAEFKQSPLCLDSVFLCFFEKATTVQQAKAISKLHFLDSAFWVSFISNCIKNELNEDSLLDNAFGKLTVAFAIPSLERVSWPLYLEGLHPDPCLAWSLSILNAHYTEQCAEEPRGWLLLVIATISSRLLY